ncbi:MAG TPA: hypothetical protein VGV60_11905 [Candidatus Polarisedimenticolia bacterium]|jgi:hypothetical protein|nr:hypothetical protein [Candidatus Polarisedimenticolia bacterium]
MSADEAPDPYFQSIEEEFVRRRGAAMLLSPRDWNLIAEWKAAGIPLRVVLQSIRNVFDAFERRSAKGRRINSLSYCRQEVASLNEIDQMVHAVEAGRPPTAVPDASGTAAVARHLGRLQRQLRSAMAVASGAGRDPLVSGLARVVSELKRLRKEIRGGVFDPRGLEEELRRLDDETLAAARATLPPETLGSIERASPAGVGPALGRMTPEARDRTRRLHEARRIREVCALPRLTLFD